MTAARTARVPYRAGEQVFLVTERAVDSETGDTLKSGAVAAGAVGVTAVAKM